MDTFCAKAMKLLVDYLEGELSAPEADRLEEHFAKCPPCMRFVETYRQTGEICAKALEREMPAEMERSLLAFLRIETGQ